MARFKQLKSELRNNQSEVDQLRQTVTEQEAKLQRLRLRQAQAEAKTNPALSPLMEEKAALLKDIREAKKLLGSGPQSAEVRIAKHNAWIEKIGEEALEAEATLSSAEQRMSEVNAEIATQVETLLETSEEKALEA